MKQTTIVILIILFLIGCKEKKKEQTEKFIFDSTKVLEKWTYKYEYKLNKKISMTEILDVYTSGKGTVSDTITTTYLYGKNGLIEKEISKSASEGNSDVKTYIYDSSDSLIKKLTINSNGDTSYLQEYKNFPDGRKLIFVRFLMTGHGNSLEEISSSYEKRKYDTMIIRSNYIYNNKSCVGLKEYDEKKQLTKDLEYEYKNSQVSKEFYYIFSNSIRMLKSTKYYDYSQDNLNPEFYSLDTNGDTIDKKVNKYENGKLILSISSYGKGNNIIKEFYENGRQIGTISYRNYNGKKSYSYYSTSYYKNGDVKEEKFYPEEIK